MVKILLFVPTFTPFTFHWYAGLLPPFTEAAVKVILVPVQVLMVEAVIVTDAIKLLPTLITTVSFFTQPPALLTVKKYCVDTVGVTVGSAIEELKPEGLELQLYVLPLTAGEPIVTDDPVQRF